MYLWLFSIFFFFNPSQQHSKSSSKSASVWIQEQIFCRAYSKCLCWFLCFLSCTLLSIRSIWGEEKKKEQTKQKWVLKQQEDGLIRHFWHAVNKTFPLWAFCIVISALHTDAALSFVFLFLIISSTDSPAVKCMCEQQLWGKSAPSCLHSQEVLRFCCVEKHRPEITSG